MSATTSAGTARPPALRDSRDARRGRRLRAAVLAAAVSVLLAACGLRLETPPPVAPQPDAVEVVRSRTVADALALAAAASATTAARTAAGTPEDALTPVLADVAEFSLRHADQLGGVYDPGVDDPAASPAPTATPTPPPSEPAQVAELLAAAAQTARADAGTVDDGELARLLASVSVARSSLLGRVSAALGAAVPDAGTPAPEPGVTPEPGVVRDPETYSGLVVAEDELGYAYEVIAARLADGDRSRAQAAAARHRVRAEAWARTSGVDGTSIDPRRTAYALPSGLEDPTVAVALAQTLELRLTADYASVVALAAPAERDEVVAALATSDAEASAWGAAPVAFPGLPEQAAGVDAATGSSPTGEPAGDESG